jgi:hypothetical protein
MLPVDKGVVLLAVMLAVGKGNFNIFSDQVNNGIPRAFGACLFGQQVK